MYVFPEKKDFSESFETLLILNGTGNSICTSLFISEQPDEADLGERESPGLTVFLFVFVFPDVLMNQK